MLQLKTQSSFYIHKINELVDFGKFVLLSLHHFRSQSSHIWQSLAQLKWPVLRRNHKLLWKCCWWGMKHNITVNKPKKHVSELALQLDLISSLQTWVFIKRKFFLSLQLKPTGNSDAVLSDAPCCSGQQFSVQFCYKPFTCPCLYLVSANESRKMGECLTVWSCYQQSYSTDKLWTDF